MNSVKSFESDKMKKNDEKENLLKNIKIQVKLLMEEYVNRKYVQEYSSNVIALCTSIELCLLLGLKRRALGLFKESSSIALLQKISKENSSAKLICSMMSEGRRHHCDSLSNNSHFSSNTNSSISSRSEEGSNGSSFSPNWSPASFFGLNSSKIFSFTNQSTENEYTDLHQRNLKKYYWIRLSIIEKVLDKIIYHLVKNSEAYYSRDSIIGDACHGCILVSLLSGTCSLEYSKVNNPEFIPEEQVAEELIQRQKIQNNSGSTGMEAGISHNLKNTFSASSLFWSPDSNQVLNKPILVTRHQLLSSESDKKMYSYNKSSMSKEYVESLHQRADSTLLYGKNNVLSHPKDEMNIPGYLSLHIIAKELLIKWTPNDLINGGNDLESPLKKSKKIEWDCAMIIWVNQIVYVHCHHHVDRGDTLVLVTRDGSQISPFEFPKGEHLISFLGCLESGLLPSFKLDPPLSFDKIKNSKDTDLSSNHPKSSDLITSVKKSKGSFLWSSEDNNELSYVLPFSYKTQNNDQKYRNEHAGQINHKRIRSNEALDKLSTDLIFRIVAVQNFNIEESNGDNGEKILDDSIRKNIHYLMANENKEVAMQWPYKYTIDSLKKRFHTKINDKQHNSRNSSIRLLCSSMKKEILSRSFYGWLAYCNHIKTIRDQLSELTFPPKISFETEMDSMRFLNEETWKSAFNAKRQIVDHTKILQQIYYGGCETSIRSKVWPFLLGVYCWDSSELERDTCLKKWQKIYELAVSDWMIIETIIEDQGHELLGCDDHNGEDCVLEIYRECNQFGEESNQLLKCCDKMKKQKSVIITRNVLSMMKQNLNRIEKDVTRCDRTFHFFDQTDQGEANLDILQRIMCTWVWQNIDTGYIQGMCDLLAPLVVIFQGNEELTYACFYKYMKKMIDNFPVKESNKMDLSFSRMRSAVQILDSDLYDHIQSYGDFTHFYFTYRWFLLDFKREFSYNDVFHVWETIWAAEKISSSHFNLFIGLSLLLSYRNLIVDNNMEFPNIIRFFNEMAEQHNANKVLALARELVKRLQLVLHS